MLAGHLGAVVGGGGQIHDFRVLDALKLPGDFGKCGAGRGVVGVWNVDHKGVGADERQDRCRRDRRGDGAGGGELGGHGRRQSGNIECTVEAGVAGGAGDAQSQIVGLTRLERGGGGDHEGPCPLSDLLIGAGFEPESIRSARDAGQEGILRVRRVGGGERKGGGDGVGRHGRDAVDGAGKVGFGPSDGGAGSALSAVQNIIVVCCGGDITRLKSAERLVGGGCDGENAGE